jgi:hypothetical protein
MAYLQTKIGHALTCTAGTLLPGTQLHLLLPVVSLP